MNKKQFLTGLIKKSANGKSYHVVASTAALDRQGEVVDQNGWDLKNFNSNPIILYSHDYSETTLPIGRAENVGVTNAGLEMDIIFATEDASPLAGQIQKLVDQGILNTLSVGFMVKDRNGNVITAAELLEVSVVKVPANAEAVITMRSMDGIDEEVKKDIEDAAAEKGEVADELNAEEVMEQKYAYLDEIWEIMYAFCSVYMDEATPVADIGKLLTETAQLLTAFAANPTTEEDEEDGDTGKAVQAEAVLLAMAKRFNVSEKIGAELSDKNKKKLSALKEHLSNGLSVVDDMMSSGSQDDGGKTITAEEDAPETKIKVAPELLKELSIQTLVTLQRQFRINATQSGKGLEIVNAFLKAKRSNS